MVAGTVEFENQDTMSLFPQWYYSIGVLKL